jgi:hypothetical protein
MGQKNSTYERRAKNRIAFEETVNAYESMRFSSPISIMDTAKDGRGTLNNATPTPLDFFCDVENQVNKIIKDEKVREKLWNTYIFGGDNILSKSRQNYYEQRIGKLLIVRGIWPIAKYFRTIRY